jgi:phosphoribosyl-ATP pyrophosphohydrolase
VSGRRFLEELETVISDRLQQRPESSYTARLAAGGVSKVAQKVGEEAIEVALASLGEDPPRVVEEAADLLFHLLLLLQLRGASLTDVCAELERRHREKS